jgi:hypothetical protein
MPLGAMARLLLPASLRSSVRGFVGAGDLEVFMEKSRSWRQNWFELQDASGRLVYFLRSYNCLAVCLSLCLGAVFT